MNRVSQLVISATIVYCEAQNYSHDCMTAYYCIVVHIAILLSRNKFAIFENCHKIYKYERILNLHEIKYINYFHLFNVILTLT